MAPLRQEGKAASPPPVFLTARLARGRLNYASPCTQHPGKLTTDGYKYYRSVVQRTFGVGCVYGQVMKTWRKNLREGIDKVFGPEIDRFSDGDRRAVLEALALVASWSSWENMRDHSGFSADEALATITLGFRRILQQPSPSSAGAVDPAESS